MILIHKRIANVPVSSTGQARKLNKLNLAAKVTLSAFILLGVLLTNSSEAHVDKISPTVKSVKIDTGSASIFANTKSQVSIVVGESLIDQQAREKAEAEAKAQTEAQAKALVLARSPRQVVARERRVYSATEVDLISLYKTAAARYGLPDWRVLEAVHYIETGGSVSGLRTSYAGAQGPMQFLPSTWRYWGVDSDGDGAADINNIYDAVYGAARYLATSGGAGEGHFDITKALLAYNHSMSYVRKVLSVMDSIPL